MQKANNKKDIKKSLKLSAVIIAALMITTTLTTMVSYAGAPPTNGVCPVADANGPYFGYKGTAITLDGSGSYHPGSPDESIVLFEWDFDSDGTYDWTSSTQSNADHTYTSPGEYTATIRVTDEDGCSDTDSSPVLIVEDNPELSESCGIDMVLIIDSSGSIENSELTIMKTAFRGFVDAFLPNTPTQIAVVEFDATAYTPFPYSTDIDAIKARINSSSSGGSTNWHDALVKAHALFDNRVDKPDLFVFASDGNPNRWGPTGSNSGGTAMAIQKAIEEANAIKQDGIKIITLGIGDSLTPENLHAISSVDDYYSSGFDTLADTLAQIAGELCGGTITVRKWVDDVPAAGWEFTATVTHGTATPSSGFTDADGFIVFDIEIENGYDTAMVDIVETHQDGFSFVSSSAVDCTGAPAGTPGTEAVYNIPVQQLCGIYAEFLNTEQGDDTPPIQEIYVGDPNITRWWRGNEYYVIGSCTPITVKSYDPESGSERIEISVWIAQDLQATNIQWQHLPQYDQTVYDDNQDGEINVTFYLDETCFHEIRYQCWNNEGITEGLFSLDLFVDKCPPVTTKVVGCPNYGVGIIQPYWISDETPLVFSAYDECCLPNGTGVWRLHIKVWWKEDTCDSSGALIPLEYLIIEDQGLLDEDTTIGKILFEYEFHFSQSGYYELEYWSEDGMCNVEQHWKQQHRVDVEPPEITKTHPSHGYMRINDTHGYLKGGSEITLSAEDAPTDTCNVGLAGLYWRWEWNGTLYPQPGEAGAIYGGDLEGVCCPLEDNITDFWWYPYTDAITFDEECQHELYYFAIDNLCNYDLHHQTYYVDNTEPYMEVEYPGHGYYEGCCVDHLKINTEITLNAYDNPDHMCQTGIESIFYRYEWDGQFFPSGPDFGVAHGTDLVSVYGADYDIPAITDYYWYRIDDATVNVSFPEQCQHDLVFFAKDNVCHRSILYELTFYVDGEEPQIDLEFPEGHGYYYEEMPDIGYRHHIKCGLEFTINATDMPDNQCAAGIETIFWRYRWNDTNYPEGPGSGIIDGNDLVTLYGAMYDFDMITDYYWYYSNNESVDIAFYEECNHDLYFFAKDNVCQRTQVAYQEILVDCTPPETYIYFPDEHGYYQEEVGCEEFVDHIKCGFQFEIHADDLPDNDCTAGIESIFWRYEWNGTQYPTDPDPGCGFIPGTQLVTLYGDDYDIPEITDYIWYRINDSATYIHFNEECEHDIFWFAKDNLCHRSEIKQHTVYVDCSEPDVWLELPGHGYHEIDCTSGYLKEGTTFTIKAEDNPDNMCAVGIESIFYRYEWTDPSGLIWNIPGGDNGAVHGTELVSFYGADYNTPEITDYWWYRINADNWTMTFDEECVHDLFFFAKDNVCQRTDIKNHTSKVDDHCPVVNDIPDETHGYYGGDIDYIKCGHKINISAYDLPMNECAAGIESIFYRYEWNDSLYPCCGGEDIIHGTELVTLYGEEYNVTQITNYYWYLANSEWVEVSFNEECMHTLYYFAKDNVCHRTSIKDRDFYVDCTGPTVEVTHPNHGYHAINATSGHLKGGELIDLEATDLPDNDCASGIEAIFWRWEWDGQFFPDDYDFNILHGLDLVASYGDAYDIPEIINYFWYVTYSNKTSISFNENCRHDLFFFAKDNVCNKGSIYHRIYFVDNEIPELNVSYPEHGFFREIIDPPSTFKDHLKQGITVTYSATDYPQNDCGAGIESIFWRYKWDGKYFPDGPGDGIIHGQQIIAKYGSDYEIIDIGEFYWYQVNDSSVDISFNEECRHDLYLFAKDNLCHRTDVLYQTFYVDGTEPTVSIKNPSHGYYPIDCHVGYLKCYTPVNLTAYDYPDNECWAGIEGIFWRYEFNGTSYPTGPGEGVRSGAELAILYGYTEPEILDYYWYFTAEDTVEIWFEEECTHELFYWAKDNLCHRSYLDSFTYYVDNTPPLLELDLTGHGYYEIEECEGYLKAGKSIWINATDEGDCQAGIESIFWRYQWDGDMYPDGPDEGVVHGTELVAAYGSEYDIPSINQYYWYFENDSSVEIWFDDECTHHLYWFAKDNVCHPTNMQDHIFHVDDSDPDTWMYTIMEHGVFYNCPEDKTYLKCGKEVYIDSSDYPLNECAAGIESIFYRYEFEGRYYPSAAGSGIVAGSELVTMYGSQYDTPEITDYYWYRVNNSMTTITFDEDCIHKLFFFAKDNVCHRSTIYNETYYVDCTPPQLNFEYPDHGYIEISADSGHLKAGTYFNVTAEDLPEQDCASGVEAIFWRYEYDGTSYPIGYDPGIYHGTDLVDMYGEAYNTAAITDYYWYSYYDGDEIKLAFWENCTHDLYIFVKDNVCNHGQIHHKTYYVDDEAPDITVTYPNHGYYQEEVVGTAPGFIDHLKCYTPITLTANDYPDNECEAGIESIFWRYEWNSTFFPSEEGTGVVTGPELVSLYGMDYMNPDIYEFLWYRVDASTVDIFFEEECIHDLYYFAKDNVCHPSLVYHNRYYVDNTAPDVDISYPGHGYYEGECIDHLKCYTPITLTAYDLPDNMCTAGLEGIFWRYEWDGQFFPDGPDVDVRTGAELASSYGYTDPAIIDFDWYYTTDELIQIEFEEECMHEFYYWAKDNVCHPSPMYHETFYVDNSAPDVTITVGEPNCIEEDCECCMEPDEYCVTNETQITISATDMPDNACAAGIEAIFYRIRYFNGETTQYMPDDPSDEGDVVTGAQLTSWYGYNNPDIVNWLWYRVNDSSFTLTFGEECEHELFYWAKDNVCHPTEVFNKTFYVDETPPPKPEKVVGDPKVYLGVDQYGHDQWMVYPGTPICFTGEGDLGCCPCEDVTIEYRYWYLGQWTEWMNYTECIYFTRGCIHYLEARAYDCLGNVGETDNESFWVCAPGGGDSDPNIEFITPEFGETYCNRTLEVIIDAYDQETSKDELTVVLYIPGGRREAPYLYYYPEYDPDKYGDEYFHAFIDIFKYQDGTALTIMAMVTDEDMNTGSTMPLEFVVCSTIVWDQWFQDGWNKLTLPFGAISCSHETEDVLRSVDGLYDWVFWYDADSGIWEFYDYNDKSGYLTELQTGKDYWVHMDGTAARYYTDTNGPVVSIEYPADGEIFYNSWLMMDIWGFAYDIETGIQELYLTVFDNDTGLYWTGSEWGAYTELPCDYNETLEEWQCFGTKELDNTYISGHEIFATVTAIDLVQCVSTDTIWFMFMDTNDPEVEITYPEDSETYDDCIEPSVIEGTCMDAETIVTSVDIRIKDHTTGLWWDGSSWGTETYLSCVINQTNDPPTWQYTGTMPTWEDSHDYSVYARATDAAGNEDTETVLFYYTCEPEEECTPGVVIEKTVWREDMGAWDEYTEVEVGETVTFNITFYLPPGGCPLCNLNLSDYLPDGLEYVPGSVNITTIYMDQIYYYEYEPGIIDLGDGVILYWSEDIQEGDYFIYPGWVLYLKFDALVESCGDFTNTVNLTGEVCECEGDCPIVVSEEDTAMVWVYCEEECEIYANVTYPYYEEINGEVCLVITGTAFNDCTCPEIENVSLALYYTPDDNLSNPTKYWNHSSGQWEETTIIYNPVVYVSGGCPENLLNWTLTVPPPFDDNSTYYIHVVAQPEDQNAGSVTSAFTVVVPQ